MSVLIKGMEIPNSCEECPLCCDEAFGSYKCCRVKGWGDDNSRAYDCPLVEIPTPHGRLIDEEAIYNNVKSRCNNCHIRACAICGVTRILNDIRTAPTIIEAEVGE